MHMHNIYPWIFISKKTDLINQRSFFVYKMKIPNPFKDQKSGKGEQGDRQTKGKNSESKFPCPFPRQLSARYAKGSCVSLHKGKETVITCLICSIKLC